jgi:hypothetical protein
LHQIDVFNDYLVIAGDTHDHSIIGSSPNTPTAIIALLSISLLDTNGYSYWQYGTSNGNYQKSNLIKYKEID